MKIVLAICLLFSVVLAIKESFKFYDLNRQRMDLEAKIKSSYWIDFRALKEINTEMNNTAAALFMYICSLGFSIYYLITL